MATCPKCHHDVIEGASFCASCGAAIFAAPSPGEPSDPFIGRTFKGTYFVEMRIGGGGMGDVYRARHVTLDVPIALKILKKALLSDASVVQRFHREARAASRLRHPNIINVTDFGQTDDGTLYMAMEHVAGKSLARTIAEEFPFSEQRVVHIGQQVLSALTEAHAGQVLHRDLKPENVMLECRRNEPDLVKVLDFGIAKIQMPGEQGATLTQAGLVCGTPGYMSPEQWGGEELDARSDLYSVAVILYEMLTGSLPFEAQTPMEMLRKHLTEKVVPPSARRKDGAISPDLEALVMRALSPAREGRPASAQEMREDLLACVLSAQLAAGEGSGARTTAVMQQPGSAPKRATPSAAEAVSAAQAELLGTTRRAGRLTPSSAGSARTPAPTARMRTPAPMPPSSGAGVRVGSTPPPQEARSSPDSAPRHELDDVQAPALPASTPGRRRAPLAVVATTIAIAGLGGGAYLMVRAAGERRAAERHAAEEARRRADEQASRRLAEEERRLAEEDAQRRAQEEGRRASEEASRRAAEEKRRLAEEAKKKRLAEAARPPRGRFDTRSKLYSFALPQAADGKGVLSINAEPPGGSVFVNEIGYGPAPREIVVPAGSYAVRVRFKGGEQSRQLRVHAGTREAWTAIFKVE